MNGLLSRMGRLVKPEIGIDNVQLHGVIGYLNDTVASTTSSWSVKRKSIMLGAFLLACYGCSLRGNEGLYLEGSDLCRYINTGKDGIFEVNGKQRAEGHVCLPLQGRFKNEDGEQKHMMVMVNEGKSGLKFRLWLERLVFVLTREGKQNLAGPAFCHEDGSMIMSHEMNDGFVALIQKLSFDKPHLFGAGIDLDRHYGISRSLRRGANSRAQEEGVSIDLRKFINRWSSYEAKKGRRPNMSMAEHYLETRLILKRTLVYSKAL